MEAEGPVLVDQPVSGFLYLGDTLERIDELPIDATYLTFIEELERKTAPDGGETVLPL